MIPTRWWRIAFVALALFVTWQTLTPDPEDTEGGMALARWIAEMLFRSADMGDKVAHFMAYAALGGSASFGQFRMLGQRGPIIAAIAVYGMALEGLQGLGGVREPEIADAMANALGVIMSFAGAAALEKTPKWRAA
jgi:VanZ family protein